MSPTFIEDTQSLELPPPPKAAEQKLREILRIFERYEPESHKRLVSCTVRTAFDNLGDWSKVLIAVVRTIIQDMNIGREPLTLEELDIAAFEFLMQVAHTLDVVEEISRVDITAEGTQAIAEHAAGSEHPGALRIPAEVQQDDEWKQIVSIWLQPEVEDCQGCGEDHEEKVLLLGDSRLVSSEKFGSLLANMALAHSGGTTDTEKDRLLVLAQIEKTFHDTLSGGMTKQ